MTDLLDRIDIPKLVRPEKDILKARQEEAIRDSDLEWIINEDKRIKQAREPISDERLADLSGFKKDEASKLLIAREFEAALRGMEEVRRSTEKAKVAAERGKPSDPGGHLVGLERNAAGKLETKGLWDLARGWNNESIKDVQGKMEGLFQGQYKLEEHQVQTALELLIAGNEYSPQQLQQAFTKDNLDRMLTEGEKERLTPNEIKKHTLFKFFVNLGIREDYVRRFILTKEFKDENQQDQINTRPKNLEELCWQIMWTDEKDWGLNGKYPMLELRQVMNPETKKKETKYFYNKANFLLWVRERGMELLDVSPYSTPDFDNEIKLNKGDFYSLTISSFYHNRTTFLRSENDWLDTQEELVRDLQLETVPMTFARQAWVTYDKSLRDPKKTAEVVQAIHEMNLVTRRAFGMDLLSFMVRKPLRDKGTTEPGEHVKNDNIMGSAWLDCLLAYEAISDFERLQEVLGPESMFFTQRGMVEALKTIQKKISMHAGTIDAYGILSPETYGYLKKAFDDNGRVTTQDNIKNFTLLVNIFYENRQDANQKEMIREALRMAMREKYGFKTERGEDDAISSYWAEHLAYSWTNWTGISAPHDTRGIGWNYMSQLTNTGMFRISRVDENAAAIGNPRTAFLFPRLLVPFLDGIHSEGRALITDQTTGQVIGTRRKSAMESLHELQAFRTKQWKQIQTREKQLRQSGVLEKDIPKQLEDEILKLTPDYLRLAGDLRFDENASKAYTDDHFNRVDELWKIINGPDINFEEFTTYDPYNFSQPKFEWQKFQEKVIREFLIPVRFAYAVHKDLNYNMKVRVPRVVPDPKRGQFKFKTEWQEVYLGEALFGHELLDCEPYWKQNKGGNYEYDENGRHIIDYNKVNDKKLHIWKRWFMCKVAADIQLKRSKDTLLGTPKPPTYYDTIFKAIESIPGAVWGDEFRMSGVTVPENLYDKGEMDDFKRKALATRLLGEHFAKTMFYGGWVWRDLIASDDEEGMGLGLMFSHIVKGIGFTKQSWLN